jgi:PIN domain nuclease of toxin-antitoxin system
MNALLDTHAFLWFIQDDPKLSNTARNLIENPSSHPPHPLSHRFQTGLRQTG